MRKMDMNQPINRQHTYSSYCHAGTNNIGNKALGIKAFFLTFAVSMMQLAQAQVNGAEAPKSLLSPTVQRYLSPTIKADLATMAAVQAQLASKRSAQPRDNDYVWVKAQRWLDVAQDEYRNNNRGTVPEQALQESQRLANLIDTPQAIAQAWETPSLDNAVMIRPDLWQQIQTLKDQTKQQGNAVSSSAQCAYGALAYAEVQLSWAAWVSSHYGWRSALPYTSHAEKKIQQAVSQYKACEQLEPKFVNPTPVQTPLAQVTIPVAPIAVATLTPQAAPVLASPAIPTTAPASFQSLTVPSKVHFSHNQSALNLDAQATLRLAAKVLSQHPALPIVIEGYADDTGSLTRNKRLSLKRAMTVKTYLLAQGIAAERMQVLGLGTIASSATKRSARQANPAHRRAQIKVMANADHAIRQQLLVHDDKVTVLCANRLPCVP
jgi:outer membrane protein OmpA-like peptidoglycan-associated protein